ncbi:unnamed protein product [Euphydryas editha]|uniref:Zinc finger PHD-type domain-containing protein n=1 Tax=Euphydryas editha TaxID=104508 RepID=A0AAU9VD76_EUPED|nr:unnamed protein product [Euphydryas editha]
MNELSKTKPNKMKFECCNRQQNSNEYIICSHCSKKYHYACVATTTTQFKELTSDLKVNWLCPECNRPRAGLDNSNTPIRAVATHANDKQDSLNVTVRNKHKVSKTSDTDLYALTPADVRQIIREELHIIFNAFQSKIETQLGNKISEISSQLTQVTESITFMEKEYEEVRRDMQQKIEVINQLESENKNLRSYIQDMDSRLSQMERNSRASNIEIQGVPEHRNENLVTAVKQLAHTIKYNLTESDIHLCTRVSKIQKNSNRPRSIIVKFSCPRVRDGFLAAAIAYNKRNSNDKLNTSHIGMGGEHKPMYVTDHLSPSMKALHAAARVKAKELKYKYVWVKGGHVYMRKSDTSDYKFIKNMDTLNSLN